MKNPSACRCSSGQRMSVTSGHTHSIKCTGLPGKPSRRRVKRRWYPSPKFSKFLSCLKTICVPGTCRTNLWFTCTLPCMHCRQSFFCINDVLTWLTVQSLYQEDVSAEWKICEIQNSFKGAIFSDLLFKKLILLLINMFILIYTQCYKSSYISTLI